MPATTQRMKVANEKASKNVLIRGNVPKSSVSRHFSNSFHKFLIF